MKSVDAQILKMGNAESASNRAELKNQNAPIKLPMPETSELERRFTKVLASMDLPPDKAKVLKQYDDEKKWDLICDQERVQAKELPAFYITKLKTYLDPKASRSSRKRRMLGDSTSTQVLRDLEISLRTNHIEWVREFLSKENDGLGILIDYLSFRQVLMRHEEIVLRSMRGSNEQMSNGNLPTRRPALEMDTPRLRRTSRHVQKLNMGEAKDDVHVCIMCLRAIMNNKYGFNMVFEHTEAINCIALSLNHRSLRTKALVLELLAAICLVKGGHEIILNAFDNFKEVCSEKHRFERLMEYFMNHEVFSVDFMVACMQFINIIVHSVEDMNFRVHLQYEFTQLGLDDYLEQRLLYTESEELKVQISAYLDNVFDVAGLMEDSETKNAALERAADMEEQLSHAHEKMQVMEDEYISRIGELDSILHEVVAERDELKELNRVVSEEVHTLKKAVSEKEEESRRRQSLLEELEHRQNKAVGDTTSAKSASSSKEVAVGVPKPPAAGPPPPPPPAPPPPPMMGLGRPGFVPPPPPGMMPAPGSAMTIKKRVQTKYKLPTLNWVALKPNQVKGTIFNDLDDDKLLAVIDFATFEENFRIGNQGPLAQEDVDSWQSYGSKRFKKPETISLLEHNRLRNMAISRRKIEMPIDLVGRAINALDLKALPLESVEILLRMVPTEQEMKLYREYEKERKPVNVLTDEDKFLLQLGKVERLPQKLNIMSYMGNFHDNIQLITPQVHAIIAASRSIKNSKKIRKLLEIILAFGNYLNSAKRGPAYGFKLQCLELLTDTKSADKRMTLMHYIVETIHTKFQDVANFDSELLFVQKAAPASLENILTDVQELEKGMELVKKEYELCKDFKDTTVLKSFLAVAEDKLRKLQADTKNAQDAYTDVAEFFGESPRTLSATSFFSVFVRFMRVFKQAELDNENRKKAEEAAKENPNPNANNVEQKNKINRKNYQDAVINELKSKTQRVQEKQKLKQDEVYNGALEDILLGLKNEPYRRADAVRRSQRRKQENVRLSRTLEELDV